MGKPLVFIALAALVIPCRAFGQQFSGTSGSASSASGPFTRSASGVVYLTTSTDNVLIPSTLTVAGAAFSVGASTLSVSNGRVGIGTTSPAYPLHNSSDTYTAGQEIVGGTMTVQGPKFSVGVSTFAVLNGNVGIGTSNPLQQLDVATYGVNGQVAFSSVPIMHMGGNTGASLASGTTFFSAPGLVSAITLVGLSFDPDVASSAGTGDTFSCGDNAGHVGSVISGNAATLFSSSTINVPIAVGKVPQCYIMSGAATKPIGNLTISYKMQ